MVGSAATDSKVEEGQFGLIRDEMLWNLRVWLLKDPTAMLPPDDKLREEMIAFMWSKDLRGKIKATDTKTIKEKIRRSPDRLMALALTFAPVARSDDKSVRQKSYLKTDKTPRRVGLGM